MEGGRPEYEGRSLPTAVKCAEHNVERFAEPVRSSRLHCSVPGLFIAGCCQRCDLWVTGPVDGRACVRAGGSIMSTLVQLAPLPPPPATLPYRPSRPL